MFAKKDQTFITLTYPSATHYLLRISSSLIFLFVFNLHHFEINKSWYNITSFLCEGPNDLKFTPRRLSIFSVHFSLSTTKKIIQGRTFAFLKLQWKKIQKLYANKTKIQCHEYRQTSLVTYFHSIFWAIAFKSFRRFD